MQERGFRTDVAGLRAVAVGLVVADHAGLPVLPGGFIGVDVFYVISGYLITSLLLRELEQTGRVRLLAFWARRARRLLPAAGLVTLVTLVWSALVLAPLRLEDTVRDGLASALYFVNYRLASTATDYFAPIDPSPFQHYWSLAVEEQFYMVWPLLIGATWFLARSRRSVGITVAVVLVASLAFCVWLTGVLQPWAFFSLPSRAWELAIGGLIAVGGARLASLPHAVARSAGILGIGLIVYAAVTLHGDSAFPGWLATLPVAGAGLVIAGGVPSPRAGVGRLLALPPLQWLGAASYSLYLWHWPLMILPVATFGRPLSPLERVALVALAVGLAGLTRRLVEDPARHSRWLAVRPARGLALAVVVALLTSATALAAGRQAADLVGSSGGPVAQLATPADVAAADALANSTATDAPTRPVRVPKGLRPSIATARADLSVIYSDGCHSQGLSTTVGRCVFGKANGATTVVLFGDSHAAQWFPALNRIAVARGWRLISITKSTCPAPIVRTYLYSRFFHECWDWRQAALARIAKERPALVVIGSRLMSEHVLIDPSGRRIKGAAQWTAWRSGYDRLIAAARGAGARVALLTDSQMGSDVPVCLSAHLSDARKCATPRALAIDPAYRTFETTLAAAGTISLVDTTRWFCPGDPCPAITGDVLLYRDSHHLTSVEVTALAPRLGRALGAVLAGP